MKMKKESFKVKIVFITFILLVFCIGQTFSQNCGDVDSNGDVDIVDALIIAQAYVELNPANYNSAVANVNNDGGIDIVDALLIAQYYIDLISSLNCGSTQTNRPTPDPTVPPGSGIDCTNLKEWSSASVYENGGTRVVYNGNVYENRWYTRGDNPDQTEVWTFIDACAPGTTPAPTPSPVPPVSWQGKAGYASRYWDCCKPHCSWSANVPAGMDPLKTCKIDGYSENPDPDAKSSCEGGDSFVCYKFIPWAIDENLSYGFAATESGDICGKCYEMQFSGDGKYDPTPGAVALKGKRMIVMATNIGYDVGGGQIDILIPGGGVGAFDGCSKQWGISNDLMGEVYGGLLTACNKEVGYYNHEAIKDCLRQKKKLFTDKGLTAMAAGLEWFIDWFEAADNPTLKYREVPCPQELIDKSGLIRP